MTEEVAETPPPPKEAGTGSLRNFRRPDKVKSTESAEKTPENNETPPPPEPEVTEKPKSPPKKGQKRKKSFEPHPDIPAEFLQEPRRERSKRGAATKAALQISMNIMHQASNVNEQLEEPLQNGVRRGKKVQPNEEILSSSPVKWKAGPRCTKVAKVKPGPRSKRRRNFQLEDLYLDQPGKVEKILKGSLDLIPSPSLSVKIQIMGRKICLRCKGKTLLGDVNKLFVLKSLLINPSNILP